MLFQRVLFVSVVSATLSLCPVFSRAQENGTHHKNHYLNEKLGVEFRYPKNLAVYQQGNDLFLDERSSQPKEWRFLDRDLVSKIMSGKRAVAPESYVLHIRVQNGSFDEINRIVKVFEPQNGILMGDLGRFGVTKAMPISAGKWKGFQTQVICSVMNPETRHHATGGECYWAIGSNGEKGFVADTLGNSRHAKLAEKVIGSIRLSPKIKDK